MIGKGNGSISSWMKCNRLYHVVQHFFLFQFKISVPLSKKLEQLRILLLKISNRLFDLNFKFRISLTEDLLNFVAMKKLQDGIFPRLFEISKI